MKKRQIIIDFESGMSIYDILNKYENLSYKHLIAFLKDYYNMTDADFDCDRYKISAEMLYLELIKSCDIRYVVHKFSCSCSDIIKNVVNYCRNNGYSIPDAIMEKVSFGKKIYDEIVAGYSIQDLSKKYNFSTSNLYTYLHKYCRVVGVSTPTYRDYIRSVMPIIYDRRCKGETVKALAKEYNVSFDILRREIIRYCNENRLLAPRVFSCDIPMDELYQKRCEGIPCTDLAKYYKCSRLTIMKKLMQYCELKGLPYPSNYRALDMYAQDIYDRYCGGQSMYSIAAQHGWSSVTVSRALKRYNDRVQKIRLLNDLKLVLEKKQLQRSRKN